MPRKGENIYKRKDGRWEGRYIKEYDSHNKAKYASVYAPTYTEVKQKLNDAKHEKIQIHRNSNEYCIECFAAKWLINMKPQVKHSTYVKYSNIVNNHIIPELGSKKIKDITTDLMRNYVTNKLQKGNIVTNGPLSPKTVKDIISVIKLIVKYSGSDSRCNFDSLIIKSSATSEAEMSRDVQSILTSFLLDRTDYTKLGVLLFLYTGIRIGELCAIRFDDIVINEKIIRITKTMQRLQTFSDTNKKTEIVITEPKSMSSQRVIPIPNFLMDIILKLDYKSSNYILTGRSDKLIEPRTLEYKFKAYLKECGLKNYKFHQLRHRFASQCVELGFDIKSLSEILGHASVNITLNRYVHSSIELKRANMDKLQYSISY